MKARHALALVGLLAVLATAVALWRGVRGPAPDAAPTRTVVAPSAGSPPPRPVVPARASPPVTAPALDAGTRTAEVTIDDPGRSLDEFPTIAELDKDVPGLAAAHRGASDTLLAASLARQQRRCWRRHGQGRPSAAWSALQTFSVDSTGRARLTHLEMVPGAPEMGPFLACISQGVVGALEFQVPDGTPSSFIVHQGDGRIVSAQEMTADEIKAEVSALTERLADPGLSAARKSLLEQHLALYRCYAEQGSARGDACPRQVDGD